LRLNLNLDFLIVTTNFPHRHIRFDQFGESGWVDAASKDGGDGEDWVGEVVVVRLEVSAGI
jgi:hypothetical protein